MTEVYQPRYRWRETWPGEGHQDYQAFDGDQSFGRIQLDKTSHTKIGLWKWNITHIPWVRKYIMPHGGWAADAREASRMVEEHYDRLKELHGL
jgi:hypothetical protein